MPVRCALARFELDQERAAVVVDRAQLVELGVVARRDHAAVAHRGRGLGGDRAARAARPSAIDRQRFRGGARAAPTAQSASDVASAGRRCSVSRSPARSRGRAVRSAMREAMRSTSTVGLQRLRKRAAQWRRRGQLRDRRVARRRGGLRAQRIGEPLPQQAAAGAGAQLSSSDNSVGAASPRSVSVISRLRRVAGSSAR